MLIIAVCVFETECTITTYKLVYSQLVSVGVYSIVDHSVQWKTLFRWLLL